MTAAPPTTIEALHEAIRQHFTKRAPIFDSEANHDFKSPEMKIAWYDRVRAWLGPEPLDVLDCGCATGFFALIAAELGHRAQGVDLTPAMVAEARRKAEVSGVEALFHVADATNPPVADASIDVILERYLFWTLPDPKAAVRNWRRVLKPGGRLVTVGLDWRSLVTTTTGGDYAPLRPMLPFYGGRPAEDFIALLTDAGYVDLVVEPMMEDVYWHDGRNWDRWAVHATSPA